MQDDLESAMFLMGLRGLGSGLADHLGDEWPSFAPRYLGLLKQILETTTTAEQRHQLMDELIELAIGSSAAKPVRDVLARSFNRGFAERGLNLVGGARGTRRRSSGRIKKLGTAPPTRTLRLGWVAKELIQDLEARYLNLRLAEPGSGRSLPAREGITPATDYLVRVDIGPLSPESIVEHSKATAFPSLELEPGEEGRWLEVVASSRDFTVPAVAQRLFLPERGPSWVCECDPGDHHRCRQEGRRPYLELPVMAPAHTGQARLRLAIYDGTRLLQSLLLTARVGIHAPGPACIAIVDYSLTSDFTDLGATTVAPMASILTNDNADATHTIIIKDRGNRPIHLVLTQTQMGDAIDAARNQLRNIHFKEWGGTLGTKQQRENLFDDQNRKSPDKFVADLRALAPLGWKLLGAIFSPGHWDWWTATGQILFKDPGILLVGRKKASQFVFPWALVYDIPLDTGHPERYQDCPVLDEWPSKVIQGKAFPASCPEEARHVIGRTICPFGFWGVRHEIEQPPSQPEGRAAAREVSSGRQPLEAVFASALTLDAKLTKTHLTELGARLKEFHVRQVSSSDDVQNVLGVPALELVYFYCHGRSTPLAPGATAQPEIEVGNGDRITPEGVLAWSLQPSWSSDHWRDTSPLVFINGCHTAEITPATLVTFVDVFSALVAAGVIGTEISVHQLLANEAAEEILARFAAGQTVGEAIREVRGHFLTKGNCVGLAYTPYCIAQLKLVSPSQQPQP